MRFVYGSEHASTTVARQLAGSSRGLVRAPAPASPLTGSAPSEALRKKAEMRPDSRERRPAPRQDPAAGAGLAARPGQLLPDARPGPARAPGPGIAPGRRRLACRPWHRAGRPGPGRGAPASPAWPRGGRRAAGGRPGRPGGGLRAGRAGCPVPQRPAPPADHACGCRTRRAGSWPRRWSRPRCSPGWNPAGLRRGRRGPARAGVGRGWSWPAAWPPAPPLRAARRRGALAEPALIIGPGTFGAHLAGQIREHPELGLRVGGFLDSGAPRRDLVEPTLGRPADLARIVGELGIRRVLICFGEARDEDLVPVLRASGRLPADVCVVPRLHELGLACRGPAWTRSGASR